jgi:hypothetical protein
MLSISLAAAAVALVVTYQETTKLLEVAAVGVGILG